MSIIGLSSALGAAYDIKKSENTTQVANMSKEHIWRAMNGNPSDEEIQYHMTRMGFDDPSQLYEMVDRSARSSFLSVLNAELDEEYSDYGESLAMKSNGALEAALGEPIGEVASAGAVERPKVVTSAQLYQELVGRIGSNVYQEGITAETVYSLDGNGPNQKATYTADEADDVHQWFVGAANHMVIDAVYDKLFGLAGDGSNR